MKGQGVTGVHLGDQRVSRRENQRQEGPILLNIPIRTIGGREIYRKAWQLAKEFDLPVCYDMQYLAVAEIEDCEFWTLDRKLVNAVRGKNKRARWVGEYKAKEKGR